MGLPWVTATLLSSQGSWTEDKEGTLLDLRHPTRTYSLSFTHSQGPLPLHSPPALSLPSHVLWALLILRGA